MKSILEPITAGVVEILHSDAPSVIPLSAAFSHSAKSANMVAISAIWWAGFQRIHSVQRDVGVSADSLP